MSNRRKRRFFKRTPQENRLEIASRGLAKTDPMNRVHGADRYPTADEIFARYDSESLPSEEKALLAQLKIPASEAEVIKIVPAKVDGVVVGTAFIHDDGLVSISFNEDADEAAMKKLKDVSEMVGYSVETGEPDGTP